MRLFRSKTSSLCIASFAILMAASVSAFAQKQDDDVIKVDSAIVLVNVAVTDEEGLAVEGLKRSEFTVLEDGKEQEVSIFGSESTPFAAVLLIDSSGSMESRISLARSAAINFLDGLRTDDAAAIYHFFSKVVQVQDFSNSHDISERIFDVKPDGMTALNDAVYEAAQVLSQRHEKRRAIIVLSDGGDNISKRSSEKALKAADAANATIYTIDMSSPELSMAERAANRGVLKKFAEKTGGTFIETPGGAAMRTAFRAIVEELGSQYTLAYEPKGPPDGKHHAIEVRIARSNLTIRTRKGYDSPKK
ncbi:MAG: VWA domain-containing protein [Chloracidobacterium sp.]|nr:VWA domain-containing protein [Chloracidobacterium sp.]MCO5332608.1 VWA domain-containing protein [Pyrinomonadaceae bacterium]